MKRYIIMTVIVFLGISFLFADDTDCQNSTPCALSKSYNELPNAGLSLATGDLLIPINLNGLGNIPLTATYGTQNLQNNVITSNLTSPTSVMGLGWSLPLSYIMVDNKNTASRSDDTFYLFQNGTTQKLLCTQIAEYTGNYSFVLDGNPNVKITYCPAEEIWDIVDENGQKTIFGDTELANNAISYSIAWGNWIGDSMLGSGQSETQTVDGATTVTISQTQVANKWYLSKLIDNWGNETLFNYIQVTEHVGSDSQSIYSKAVYLHSITDFRGNMITLQYSEKSPTEYVDPHQEYPGYPTYEPDAYQECYETKYLSSVTALNQDGIIRSITTLQYTDDQGNTLFTTAISGQPNMSKRLLTHIVVCDASQNTIDRLDFNYCLDHSMHSYSFLTSITPWIGGCVVYHYSELENVSSRTISDISSYDDGLFYIPNSNGPRAHIYIQQNYVVIIRDDPTISGSIRVYGLYWDGQWITHNGPLCIIPNCGALCGNSVAGRDDNSINHYQITLQQDYFAIINRVSTSDGYSERILSIFSWSNMIDNWVIDQKTIQFHDGEKKLSLSSGENFICIIGTTYGWLSLVSRRQNQPWGSVIVNNSDWLARDNSDSDYLFSVTATNNYYVIHHPMHENSPYIRFGFLRPDNTWKIITLHDNSNLTINSSALCEWRLQNDYAAVQSAHGMYIYQWDADYNNFRKTTINDDEISFNPLSFPSLVGAICSEAGYISHWNGIQWINYNIGAYPNYCAFRAVSQDCFSYGQFNSSNNVSKFWIYTPYYSNSLFAWNATTFGTDDALSFISTSIIGCYSQSAPNYMHWFSREPQGWILQTAPTDETVVHHFFAGERFYVDAPIESTSFSVHYKDSEEAWQTQVLTGVIYNSRYYDNPRFVSATTIAALNSSQNGYILYRFLQNGFSGSLCDIRAISITKSPDSNEQDGIVTHFNFINARSVGNNEVSFCNCVTEYTGESISTGYIAHCFYNGSSSGIMYPLSSDDPMLDYAGISRGIEYRTRIIKNTTESDNVLRDEKRQYRIHPVSNGFFPIIPYVVELASNTTITPALADTVYYEYNGHCQLSSESCNIYHTETRSCDFTCKQYRYAWQDNEEMLDLNILSPISLSTLSHLDEQAAIVYTDIQVTTYYEFYTGHWGIHKRYIWDGTTNHTWYSEFSAGIVDTPFSFSLWSGTSEPANDEGWIKTEEITQMNCHGVILEKRNTENRVSSVRNSVDIITYASAENSESSQWRRQSFESYDNALDNTWNNYPSASNHYLSSEKVYSGIKSLKITSSYLYYDPNQTNNSNHTSYMEYSTLSGTDVKQNEIYVFSAFVWAGMVNTWSNQQIKLSIKYKTNTNSNWIYLPDTATGCFNPTSINQWVRLWTSIDLNTIADNVSIIEFDLINMAISSNYEGSACYFDEVRVQPVVSSINSSDYDPVAQQTISAVDDFGNTMFTVYNQQFQKKIIWKDKSPQTLLMSIMKGFSRNTNTQHLYNSSSPNISIRIKSATGFVDDFRESLLDSNHWTTVTGVWAVNTQSQLSQSGTSSAQIRLSLSQGSSMGYDFEITACSGTDYYTGIIFMANNVIYTSGQYYMLKITSNSVSLLRDGNVQLGSVSYAGNPIGRWLLIYKSNKFQIFKDGLCIATWAPATLYSQGQYISLITQACTASFDDVAIYQNPSISADYIDGAGRTVQSQAWVDNDLKVSQTIFDSFGRPAISTKTGGYAYSAIGYRSTFASYNWTTCTLTGDLVSQYPADAGRPYSRTLFEDNPLSRPIEKGLPGNNFSIESGASHTTKMFYDVHPETYNAKFVVGQFYGVRFQDPNGIDVIKITNKRNQEIMTIVDPTGINQRTENIYNDKGDVIETRMPNYFNPPAGSRATDWIITYNYDHFDRILSKTSPDYGLLEYQYDKVGRLLCSENAQDRQLSRTIYNKYDELGRLVETGYVQGSIRGINYTELMENNSGRVWTKRNYYDQLGTNSGLRGSLWRSRTHNGDSNNNEVDERISYDTDGRITRKDTIIHGYNDSRVFTFKCSYNADGTIRSEQYPNMDACEDQIVTQSCEGTISALDDVTFEPSDIDTCLVIQPTNALIITAGNSVTIKPGVTLRQGSNISISIEPSSFTIPKQVQYTYNQTGTVTGIGNGTDRQYYASYQYNRDGSLQAENLNINYNNTTNVYPVQYNYNSPGWVQGVSCLFAKATVFAEAIDYTSTGQYNGNIVGIDFTVPSYTHPAYSYDFTYNHNGQLASASAVNADNAYNYNNIMYDANGNMLSLTHAGQPIQYTYQTGSNRVSQLINSQTNTVKSQYSYDANGNITASNRSTAPDLVINYDPITGRTTRIDLSSSSETGHVDFAYDSSDERVIKSATINGQSVNKCYLYGISEDYPMATIDNANNIEYYIYGPTGLVAKETATNTFHIIKDHLGSTRVVVNNACQIVSCYDYDAFGNQLNNIVTEIIGYQYTGQEYDDETELHNFRARFYDSELLRFYEIDPAEQGFSPYLFCGNNPIMLVDRNGEIAWIPILAAVIFAHSAYNGYQYAQATENPMNFLVGANSTFIIDTSIALSIYSMQASNICSSTTDLSNCPYTELLLNGMHKGLAEIASSTIMSSIKGDTETSLFALHYDWDSKNFRWSRIFDNEPLLENIGDFFDYIQLYSFAQTSWELATLSETQLKIRDAIMTAHPNIKRGFWDKWTSDKFSPTSKDYIPTNGEEAHNKWYQRLMRFISHYGGSGPNDGDDRYRYAGGLHNRLDDGEWRMHFDAADPLVFFGLGDFAHLVEAALSDENTAHGYFNPLGDFLRPWVPYAYRLNYIRF